MNESYERRRKPSVKQISELTGFSPAAVSLALNQKGTLSEDTRNIILKAYREMDRSDTPADAKSLLRLLIEEPASSTVTDPYVSEIIMAIEEECASAGYEVILTYVRPNADVNKWVEGVAGLLLLGGGQITDSMITQLQDAGIPCILVDNYIHYGALPSIQPDHYEAGYMATEYLIGLGHTKIGFISGPSRYKTLVDRFAGYCSAMIKHGIQLNVNYIASHVDQLHIKGYREMKALMELADPPTAVFAVSDKSALGAVAALKEMGMVQGRDVDLMGCDNIPALRELQPRIATIDIPRWEVGQMAVRFLIEAVKGNTFRGKVVLPGRLVLPEEV
jgi:DNA-binding LacI/PurR family transcriptional regulator